MKITRNYILVNSHNTVYHCKNANIARNFLDMLYSIGITKTKNVTPHIHYFDGSGVYYQVGVKYIGFEVKSDIPTDKKIFDYNIYRIKSLSNEHLR